MSKCYDIKRHDGLDFEELAQAHDKLSKALHSAELALQSAESALQNVPGVGEVYDQQHRDTHMAATLAIQDALTDALEIRRARQEGASSGLVEESTEGNRLIPAIEAKARDWILHADSRMNQRIVDVSVTRDDQVRIHADFGNGGEPATLFFEENEKILVSYSAQRPVP